MRWFLNEQEDGHVSFGSSSRFRLANTIKLSKMKSHKLHEAASRNDEPGHPLARSRNFSPNGTRRGKIDYARPPKSHVEKFVYASP